MNKLNKREKRRIVMSQTLTLEFSDKLDIEQALGHVRHGDPSSIAAALGISRDELMLDRDLLTSEVNSPVWHIA
jgi:hypothetical protein